jgi:hypothetical protein
MFTERIALIQGRAKTLQTLSTVFLLSNWLGLTADFLTQDGNSSFIAIVFYIVAIPVGVTSLIYVSQWTKSLMETSRQIQPEGFGYRQGWSFWAWVTPVMSFWVPKRLVDNTYLIFRTYVGAERTLNTSKWWTYFVANALVGLIAFPGEGAFAINFFFALISTLFLTAAYPLWKQVVTEVTAAQVEALEKLELA